MASKHPIFKAWIPGKPVSVNNLWRGRGRHVSRSAEAVAWTRNARLWLSRFSKPRMLPASCRMVIEYVRPDWLTKKGEMRKVDVSNYIKLCEDVVFEHLGEDDRSVCIVQAEKVMGPEEGLAVAVYPCKLRAVTGKVTIHGAKE